MQFEVGDWACAWPSVVYPAGGLRAGLPSLGGREWLLVVPVGSSGLCLPGDGPFRCVCLYGCMGRGGGWWIGASGLCAGSRARCTCPPRLPRFILLINFSDTLLVVSILDLIAI